MCWIGEIDYWQLMIEDQEKLELFGENIIALIFEIIKGEKDKGG
jgi:hypothetical protein